MAATKVHNDLRVDTGYRQIFRLSLPITFAILVPQVNFITNNVFLGHFSQQALAAGAVAGVYHLIFAMVGYGLNNGLQTLISRRAGENRPEEIGRIFSQGLFLSLLIALFGIALTWIAAPPLFKAVIHDPVTAGHAIEFMKWRILGLPFLYAYQMRNALLVGTNNTRLLAVGAVAETASNILFDYLLIFGHAGLPALGLTGAAIASVIAEFTGMIVIFGVIHYRGLGAQYQLFNYFKWDRVYAKQIFSISLPLIFQLSISVVSWEFFFVLVEHHGQAALAISQVMRNLFGLTGCFTWAFAATASAMVSNIIGQGRQDEVKALVMRITRLSLLCTAILAAIINIFPQTFLSIFGQEKTFIDEALPVMRVVSSAMLMMSVAVIWLNAVTGTGNSRITFLVELLAISLYCVFVYCVLEIMNWSIVIGWMSEWLYWSSIFVCAWLYMRGNRWRNKAL